MSIVEDLPPEIVDTLVNLGIDINNEEEVLIALAIGLGIATLRRTKNGYTLMVLPEKRTMSPRRQLVYYIDSLIMKHTRGIPPGPQRSKIMKQLFQELFKEFREEKEQVLTEEKKRKIEERLQQLLKSIKAENNLS